jgi:hypothetical protein
MNRPKMNANAFSAALSTRTGSEFEAVRSSGQMIWMKLDNPSSIMENEQFV